MTSPAKRADSELPFEQVRAFMDAKAGAETTFSDVVALAEITAQSMQTFFASIDRTIYRELREISDFIVNMRSEIAHLRAAEMKTDRLPAAGEHLGQIVVATEEATNAIMEAAEAMLAAQNQDEATYKALVNEKVMAIFEACSFQDITGQRIARVIETLDHVEARIGRFAEAVKSEPHAAEAETPAQRRARELMINGPQARERAIAQTEVDALMARDSVDGDD